MNQEAINRLDSAIVETQAAMKELPGEEIHAAREHINDAIRHLEAVLEMLEAEQ